jgi:Pretoxin HINT domain
VIQIALASAVMLVGQISAPPESRADLKPYEALKAKAGSNPSAQVKLALWCEAHGLGAERMKHLATAVLSDPMNAAARGLLGLVESNGKWQSPEQVRERIKADDGLSAKLADYERRRAKLTADELRNQASHSRQETEREHQAAYSARLQNNRRLAQAHADLALWCSRNGLKPEATAHFAMAVHLDPYRDSSWKNLGYVKRQGRWTSREQAEMDEREDRAQREADRYWEPLLKKWRTWLGDSRRRAAAEDLLATVTDRRAVPSILKFFSAQGSEAEQLRRARLLGQIDDRSSSRALASQAIWTRFDLVRREAVEILRTRPLRDYAADLIEMIHGTIRYEVRPISGPASQGALAIDAPRFRMTRTYDVPHAFELHSSFRGYVGYDDNGLPIVVSGRELDTMRGTIASPQALAAKLEEIEARTATMLAMATETARRQMAADIYAIETTNQEARENNASIIPVLKAAAAAPASLEDDEDAWHVWWYDKLGYKYEASPKPTFTQDATPQYEAAYIRTCFAAGTPVHTLDGTRSIEAIQVGDQVLSQDAASGALSFQPVAFVHRNPPDQTLRIRLSDGESVVCSIYHRFWRANVGWAQARELKPGDTLRRFGGILRVDSVGPDSVQPLYNLDVLASRTFFVGASKLLVHDNTLPDHRLVPFDALPAP